MHWAVRYSFLLLCALGTVLAPLQATLKKSDPEKSDGYTINFDNVPIKEFLKFISKVAGINVIYNEPDLDFNVTIVSQEPTDLNNILSALVQVLRIHGLTLIEEEKNLLIHKNDGIRQIPTVVSKEMPLKGNFTPAIMTKVFQIQNGNPAHIAALITPMLSKEALVEVSMDTRQLIITDVSSSLSTIESLLLSLDAPETPYDVEPFHATSMQVFELAALAKQILAPIANGTTLELVPQIGTQTLYIVSTPFLIDKTQIVLRELDKQPHNVSAAKALNGENVLVYKLQYKSADEVETELKKVVQEAKNQGFQSDSLAPVINSMKYIKSTNSLMFVGPPQDLAVISSFLKSIDGGGGGTPKNTSFYLFEPKQLSLADTMKVLKEISEHLDKIHYSNPTLIVALKQAQAVIPINAILFTGDPETIKELQTLLASIASSYAAELTQIGPTKFLIYTIKHANEEQIRASLHSLADYLEKSPEPNEALLQTIDSMRWIKATNSLLFTGPSSTLQELSEILPSFDVPPEKSKTNLTQVPPSTDFVIYSSKQMTATRLKELITETAGNLKSADLADPAFIKTLESARVLPASNQLIFTGDKTSLERLNSLLQSLTNSPVEQPRREVVFVPVHQKSSKEIVKILHDTAQSLAKNGSDDASLIQTLKTADSTVNGNTVILSGTALSIQKAQELIAANDSEQRSNPSSEVFVYKLRYLTPTDLQSTLRGIAEHADNNQPSQEISSITKAVDTMRVIPDANAVQFVASPNTIAKLKEILVTLDTPENVKSKAQPHMGTNFLVYKVKNLNPQELLAHLKQIVKASPSHDTLMKSVSGAQYAAGSNSLVFTGDKADLDKIQILLDSLDQGHVPKVSPVRHAEGYKIYRPQYVPGQELIIMVRNFEQHLVASGVTNEPLAEVVDHLSYVDRTNTIILTGNETDIDQVLALLREFDNQQASFNKGSKYGEGSIETIDDTGFLIYKLQHQSGSGIVHALSVISRDLGSQTSMKRNEGLIEAIHSTQWIEPTNSLIATGQPKMLAKLRELIESIDQPLKQVFIEVLVLETNNTYDLEFGLRWGSQGAVDNKFSWGSGNYSPLDSASQSGTSGGFPTNFNQITGKRVPTGSDIPPIEGGLFGAIGDIVWHQGKSYAALGSLLNAIRSDGNITVVLSQKIVAQDNQNAKIFSGSNIPFTGSLVTTSGLSQTTNANLEYRNIGVTLSITPIIGDNDIVTLDIDQEISEVADQGSNSGSTSATTNTVNGIQTTKTSMQTRVHMPDRHFLILSGTMRNQVTRNVAGIPCLGGLPLIGAAFSESQRLTAVTNVVIFVKPHIIKNSQMYVAVTKSQEELFGSKEQANVDDFQKGMELIKSADDEDDENTL